MGAGRPRALLLRRLLRPLPLLPAQGREPLCNDLRFVSVAIPGGMSELFRCPADQLLALPEALDDVHAAAVMAAFGTSYHMLFTRAGLRAGERVLITSVGAGIASAAVQLARWAGATVIGTSSSPEKLEQARALGLDHGIDYTTTDVVEEVLRLTDGEGVELAYEHVGGARFAEALGSIGKDGRVVTCGATPARSSTSTSSRSSGARRP